MIKKALLGILVFVLLAAPYGYCLWAVYGKIIILGVQERRFYAHMKALEDIERIEVLYRPDQEWTHEPDDNSAHPVTAWTITDPNEIERIVAVFREARHFDSIVGMCGYHIKVRFYGAGNDIAGGR